MHSYTEQQVNELFADPAFRETYEAKFQNRSDLREFSQFINGIELNTKYFRLAMSKGSKKYKNRNLGEDTIAIKEVKSYLNKISDKNYTKLSHEIKTRLEGREYLMNMLIDTIVDKCILHTPYIAIYLKLVKEVYGSQSAWKRQVEVTMDKAYQALTSPTKREDAELAEESDYLKFCEKNKLLDRLVGHSLLVTECEKQGIVKGRFEPAVASMIKLMDEETDNDEKYKCVQCLYGMLDSFYGKNPLPPEYQTRLNDIIGRETYMKLKFKMMDIVERR